MHVVLSPQIVNLQKKSIHQSDIDLVFRRCELLLRYLARGRTWTWLKTSRSSLVVDDLYSRVDPFRPSLTGSDPFMDPVRPVPKSLTSPEGEAGVCPWRFRVII